MTEQCKDIKIIDAHLHLFEQGAPRAEKLAQDAGHQNNTEHLREVYTQLGICHGVVMGNRSLALEYHQYPADLFHYCIGLDSSMPVTAARAIEQVEMHLQRKECCGIKLYPGYNKVFLTDPLYEPVYEAAARYDKPVAIHMGQTANARAHLKYCHPMILDEVAADHPDTRFVMCHFGSPFLETAAAVVEKNPNVAADLSGLLEGRVDVEKILQTQAGYVFLLKTWLAAIGCWDRIMFGTDWPLVNIGEYIRFIAGIVPEDYHAQVFFENANRIYKLGL